MSNGKGDAPRNCFSDAFRDNHDHIFRKREVFHKTIFWANFAGVDKDGAVDEEVPRWVAPEIKPPETFGDKWDRIFAKEKASKSGTNTPLMGAEKQRKLPNENIRKHR